MNLFQSASSLQQKLRDILALFSKAGISVVEFRDYHSFVDLVIDKPMDSQLFKKLYNELLISYEVLTFQLRSGELPIIRLVPYARRRSRLYKYRWALFAATIVTVFLTGIGLSQGFHSEILRGVVNVDTSFTAIMVDAILYTLVFLTTLISHELGHLIIGKRCGIESEGPILLPAPPIQLGFIGTLGAVILTKTPPSAKKDLAKLGILGPLMGIIVATLFGIAGLYLSPSITLDQARSLIELGTITPIEFASLGLYLLVSLKPGNGVILFHPILFVTYFMYLVTFLNLLPVGQLDGGHVVRSALSARVFNAISTLIPLVLMSAGVLLFVLGANGLYFTGIGFLAFVLYLISRRGHPGVANQYDDSKCPICLILYAILLVLTLPIPLP